MIDKPWYIVLGIYAISFMILAGQYLVGDIYGITLVNNDAVPIKTNTLTILDMDSLNDITYQIANSQSQTNSTLAPIENSFNIGMFVGWQVLTVLTGVFAWNFLLLVGIPWPFIAPIALIFYIMLGRTIIALIRGV